MIALKAENLPTISLAAYGVLAQMTNLPDCDYITAADLKKYSEKDTVDSIETALNELVNKNYVTIVDGRYAVNKIALVECMRVV